MSDLLNAPIVQNWVEDVVKRHSKGIFGNLKSAIIWSDARDENGELLVPLDPVELAAKINENPFIVLHNHDPGRPKGQVLESAIFEDEKGGKFVAAVLGFYANGEVLNFRGMELDTTELVSPPESLPALPDNLWIQLATDSREVDAAWLNEVTSDTPLRIEHAELSHNAADSAQELIRIGLVYVALVWNPFITSIATEAGKGVYTAIHEWIRKLLTKLADRRNPVLDLQSHQGGCQVSFLIRGKEVRHHYAAHDALSNAAAQAAQLIDKLKARGMPARTLIYEFDRETLRWFPSYAILNDNRIITDNGELIAIEQLPTGLSLGLSRGEFISPVVGSVVEDEGI